MTVDSGQDWLLILERYEGDAWLECHAPIPLLLVPEGGLVIGRAHFLKNDDAPDDAMRISREHCCLDFPGPHWRVRDTSTHGTAIVRPGHETRTIHNEDSLLFPGDALHFANYGRLTFRPKRISAESG